MHLVGSAVGFHVLRWVLVLVVVGPLAGAVARRRAARGGGGPRDQWLSTLRVRFAVIGLLLGGTWVWRSNAPLWEHALRLVIVMLVVAPVLGWIRHRGAEPRGRSGWSSLRVRYWIPAKLALIGVGAGVQAGLEQAISRTDASLIVGAMLAIAVALGGPAFMVWAARRRRAGPADPTRSVAA